MKKIILFCLLIVLSIVLFGFFCATYNKGAYSIVFLATGGVVFAKGLDIMFNLKKFRNLYFDADKKHNLKENNNETDDVL